MGWCKFNESCKMVTLSETRKGTCRDYNHPSRTDESIVQTTNFYGDENRSSKQNRKDSVSKAVGVGSSPTARARFGVSQADSNRTIGRPKHTEVRKYEILFRENKKTLRIRKGT